MRAKKGDKVLPSPLIETESEQPEGNGGFVNSQFTKREGTLAKEPVTVVMKEREICPNCGLGLDFPREVLINSKPVNLCMDYADQYKQICRLSMPHLLRERRTWLSNWMICQASVLPKRRRCGQNCPRSLGREEEKKVFFY